MNVDFVSTDRRIKGLIALISKKANRYKAGVYVVGGLVRDILLGRQNCDLDVVVEGDSVALAKSVARARGAKVTVHRQFATATVHCPDGLEVDFAMARKEVYLHSGDLPKVYPGSIRDDLFRRDFTINTLAVALNESNFGKVVDLYGGVKDLNGKRIRVLHEKSFIDDPTRILRAVRFEQRFDFTISALTRRLLKKALKENVFENIKKPRYFEEFRKVIKEPCPFKCFKRLKRLGALDVFGNDFMPGLKLARAVDRRVRKLGAEFFYRSLDWSPVHFLCFFSEVGADEVEKIASVFNFTRKEKELLETKRYVPKALVTLKKRSPRPSEVYRILSPLPLELIYFMRACTGSRFSARHIDKFLMESRFVKLNMKGDDLKKKGFVPGKAMGRIMNAVLMSKIDGFIKDRRDELKEAGKLMLEKRMKGE